MTHHPESSASYEHSWLIRQTERHVERHLDRGDVVFRARPLMAAAAIFLTSGDRFADAMDVTAHAAIATLEVNSAEGSIFAFRRKTEHSQDEDGIERVIVTARAGVPTEARHSKRKVETRRVITRYSTASPEDLE